MIDFDEPKTFPIEIQQWVVENKKTIMKYIPEKVFGKGWEISAVLEDCSLILDFPEIFELFDKQNFSLCVWHATRILNREKILEEGKLIRKNNEYAKKEITSLLKCISVSDKMIEKITDKASFYIRRDEQRRGNIYFFFGENYIDNPGVNAFALNVGGELLRWALNAINKELYKQEPYKRLWIIGEPCIIKFKVKFSDLDEHSKRIIVKEIVNYFIVIEMFGLEYDFECTGSQKGSVLPKDIIEIKRIDEYENYQIINGFEDSDFYL